MQQKYLQHESSIIDRLNAKILYQEREIQRLNQLLSLNQTQNLSRLVSLLTSQSTTLKNLAEQISFGQPDDSMSTQSSLNRLLAMQVRHLNGALQDAEEKRAISQAELLINKQILIQQTHFSNQLVENYEQKIRQLRKSLLSKQMLLDGRRQNQAADKKQKKLQFTRADQEMVFKRMMDVLQQSFIDQKRERLKFRRQYERLKIHYDQTRQYNRKLCEQMIDFGILPEQPPCELLQFEEDLVEPEFRKNTGHQQQTVEKNSCCIALRQILYKKSIIQKQLLQQVHMLKKMVEDMKASYDIMVKANIEKDDIIRRKACQSQFQADKTQFSKPYQKYCLLKMGQQINQRLRRFRLHRPPYKYLSKSSGQRIERDKYNVRQFRKAVQPFLGQFSAISQVECTMSRYLVRNFQEI